jgi:hypothetical protein
MGVRGQRHTPAALYPRESPRTHWTGGWVGPRAALDGCGKSRPTGIRSPDHQVRSAALYRVRFGILQIRSGCTHLHPTVYGPDQQCHWHRLTAVRDPSLLFRAKIHSGQQSFIAYTVSQCWDIPWQLPIKTDALYKSIQFVPRQEQGILPLGITIDQWYAGN